MRNLEAVEVKAGLSRSQKCGLTLVAVCALAGFSPAVHASPPNFLIDVWDAEKGLPDSTVTAIQQTRDGYLWVGTYNGLARFDGVQFEVFDPLNTPALVNPRIWALFLDANGVLWINTYDGSLTSYRAGEFRLEYRGTMSSDVRFSLVDSTPDEITFGSQIGDLLRRRVDAREWEVFRPTQSPRPSYYYQDAQGQVWWQKFSQGQYGRVKNGQLETVDGPAELRGSRANFLTVDSAGRLWVGTDKGLGVWENGEFRVLTPTNGEPDLNVEFILPVAGDTNWVWADSRLRKQEGRRWVKEIPDWQGLLGTAAGRRMGAHFDHHGGIWFNHYGNGLFYISPDGVPMRLTSREGLPGNRVGAWFEDREGNIWVGVDRGGLARLRPPIFQVIGEAEGLPARAVTSVIEDSGSNILMATFGGGVHEWRNGALHPMPLNSRSGRFVFSLCELRPGVTWMSAVDEDLYVQDVRGFRRAPWDAHGVKVLMKDGHGRLWAGWKDGVGYWDPESRQATQIEEGFESSPVRALVAATNGAIWFGSDDGSLYRFQNDTLHRYRSDDALSGQPVWSLWPEEDGTVWVGTFRGGLLRFRNGRFTRYTRDAGLPDDSISQILDDEHGRLWCGSHRGIFHVNKKELNEFADGERTRVDCVAYGRLDGLPSLECSSGYNPSCLRTPDSSLWFATTKGLVSVHPGRVSLASAPPPVVIQEMRVDGVRQSLPPAHLADTTGFGSVEVSPGRRQFRFHFAALNLSSPERVRFRYRLLGHERDWIEAGTRREAIYSSLPPGRYEFQVTARNSEGDWNRQIAAARFDLLPYFYETWLFRGVAGFVLISVSVLGVRRVATRKLRRELALAEQRHAIELDRARIARDIHDDLGAGLTEISLLGELAQRDTKENVVGYLGQISNAARGLVRAMDETVWAITPENDTLEGLITYASKLAQDYLSVAGIRCRLDVPTRLPEVSIAADVRHHLYLAIKEALNNIVKHSRATEAMLRVSLTSGEFSIVIEDNGRGISGAVTDGSSGLQRDRLHSGHGIENLASRLQQSGGRCLVSSQPGGGTRVEFVVKVEGLLTRSGE